MWVPRKEYVELVAKRDEVAEKREEARYKRDLKDVTDTLEKLRKDLASLRGYLYRTGTVEDEDEDDETPVATNGALVAKPVRWPQ